LPHHCLGGNVCFVIEHQKFALPAIHTHQIGHQLPGYRERRAIRLAHFPVRNRFDSKTHSRPNGKTKQEPACATPENFGN
jgi:hypothetical protein